MLITTTSELISAVERLKQHEVIAIDTEFMREKTYFAKLCLIQIGSADEVILIDPLADIDLSPLAEIFCDPAIMKVFHAGTQDIEILYLLLNKPVTPMFDTQVAAALLGYPEQVGYGALVAGILDVKLDKADSFTDWARRPLTAAQIEYARNDVIYLLQAYPLMVSELEKSGRLSWLDDEFARKADPKYFMMDSREQWRRLKKVSALNRRQLAVAREVADWREREAMRLDIPKRWVIGDESVIEIARRQPSTKAELEKIRGVGNHALRTGSGVLDAVVVGKEVPEDALPSLAKKRRPSVDIDASVDLMLCLVKQRAKDNNIAVSQLAPRSLLEEYATTRNGTCELVTGWRKAMVGDELEALLDGRITLSLSEGALVVEKT